MSDIMSGRYALAEPGGGLTVLSMDGGEIDLFGDYTSIKTTATDFFSDIGDSLIEKAVEHPAVGQLVLGALATAAFASLAIAAVSAATFATGGLALVALGATAAGCAGASIGTGIYTAGIFAYDTVTGYNRSYDNYMDGLIKMGACGFWTGLGAYLSILSFPAGPALELASGEIVSEAAAVALPAIIANIAEIVLALDGAIVAGVLLSEAMNGGGGGLQGDKDGVHFEEDEEVSVKPTQEELDTIKDHLSGDMQADFNDAMIERIEKVLEEGGELKGPDAEFYRHELEETRLMNQGLDYDTAHNAALDKYGVTEFDLYHPDVIESMPEWFGPAWFEYWGISK